LKSEVEYLSRADLIRAVYVPFTNGRLRLRFAVEK